MADVGPYTNNAEVNSIAQSTVLAYLPTFDEYVKRAVLTGYQGAIDLSSPAPTKPGLYVATQSGTYTNYGGLVVDITKGENRIYYSADGTFKLITISIDATTYAKKTELTALQSVLITSIQSTFSGLKVFCLGDSFTQLALYQQYLINRLGVSVQTDGIGGSCIAGNTGNAEGDGTFRTPGVDRIDAALATNPNIIIIEFGSNDWYYNSPLGDINSTDRNTYYGAWKEVLGKCAAVNYPLLVVPVTLMQRNGTLKIGGPGGRTGYTTQLLRAKAVIEVADMYGIDVCNVFNHSGMTYENSGVYTSDGTHPDKPAGKDKYGNFLASFIYDKGFLQTFGFSQSVSNEAVTWANLQQFTSVLGNTIKINNGTALTDWIAGGNANKRLISGDGNISIPGNAADAFVMGFSKAPLYPADPTKSQYNYQQLAFGAYYNNVVFRVFENGTNVFQMNVSGTAKPIKVSVESGAVKYYYDGAVVYTSAQAASYPLYPAVTMDQFAGTNTFVTGATISGTVGYY
jgi:lysophospholipase L1-like esterase